MAIKKYINVKEVAELTGHSENDIRNLAQTGVLHAHKTRRGHWRLNVDAVEKYFCIHINPTVEGEKPVSATESQEASKQVNEGKLISRLTARKYLNCSKGKFQALVDQGIIQAHRDEYKRWKVSKESVLNYIKQSLPSSETRFIINENHYPEVMQRICAAKLSIRIMTANFKRFRLKPTDNQGDNYKDGTPFIKHLMEKAIQGVSVQIICSKPSLTFTEEWKEYYRQMNPVLLDYKFCDRNHAKVIIIDDKLAYIGSANITPKGIGQGIFTPGNFEAGVLTDNPEVVSSAKALFSMIWEGKNCNNKDCHRAKECRKFANKELHSSRIL